MRKSFAILPVLAVLAGCVTVDFTAPLQGKFDNAGLAYKAFEVIGPVSVSATETHRASPLSIVRTVEGAKVTYSDLMQEAARLGADDIIDVRIDMNTSGKTNLLDRLTGWERIFTHTGQAVAIRYVSGKEGDAKMPMDVFPR